MQLDQIHIRDPFILPWEGRYYLYGTRGAETWAPAATGFDVYVSQDLAGWSDPAVAFQPPVGFWSDRNFWAPEVHAYRGRFYMLASFKSADRCRGTQALVADSPAGPFMPFSDGPLTPPDWECLDGTLYVSPEGVPSLVFCHEWVQAGDGGMCAVDLAPDLSRPVSAPRLLFHASDHPRVRSVNPGREDFVTDGPFLYRGADGTLFMLWSSFTQDGYMQAVAVSETGGLAGPWRHDVPPLFTRDGGHGMLFTDGEGRLRLALHRPNENPLERPCLFTVLQSGKTLRVLE